MYLQQGITSWINNWKLNNWRTASKKEVKNSDLWKRLDDLSNTLNVSWNWVKLIAVTLRMREQIF